MTPELTALTLCGLLQMVQFILFAVPANLELGTRYTAGPRDRRRARLSPRTARLQRAMNNHFEGLILFTLAVVVITVSNQSTTVTQTAAWVFLAARVLYVPAYALAAPLALAIWGVGWFATLTLMVAALF